MMLIWKSYSHWGMFAVNCWTGSIGYMTKEEINAAKSIINRE
jgi:hypothetical protein